jgi:hypothetical protein
MNFVIAIRSSGRYNLINKYTIQVIKNIDCKKVFIFVPKNEIEKYRIVCPQYTIVEGSSEGIIEVDRKITDYFDEGQYIIQLDDDIKKISKLVNKKTLKLFDLEELIKIGYEYIKKTGYNIWGVYPTANPYFMSNKITYHMNFIIGAVVGFINDREIVYKFSSKYHADYEKTILFYEKYGGVIRFNFIAVSHLIFTGGGGVSRTIKKINDDVDFMLETYSKWIAIKKNKKKWKSIRLRSIGSKVISYF